MSRLAQEMINTILNGTDSVAHTKQKNSLQCPNCGSTAQPKLNTPPSVYENGKLIVTTHKCGCGCVFQRHYAIAEIKVTSKGDE